MVRTGRPKQAIQKIKRTFKITPDQDEMIDVVLRLSKIRADPKDKAKDRSHIVRLALENYFIEFYG